MIPPKNKAKFVNFFAIWESLKETHTLFTYYYTLYFLYLVIVNTYAPSVSLISILYLFFYKILICYVIINQTYTFTTMYLGDFMKKKWMSSLFGVYFILYALYSYTTLTKFPYIHSDEPWLAGLSKNYVDHTSSFVTEPFFDFFPGMHMR